VTFTVYTTLMMAAAMGDSGLATTLTCAAAGAPIAEPITKSIANENAFDET
jgi:hypothetical protein